MKYHFFKNGCLFTLFCAILRLHAIPKWKFVGGTIDVHENSIPQPTWPGGTKRQYSFPNFFDKTNRNYYILGGSRTVLRNGDISDWSNAFWKFSLDYQTFTLISGNYSTYQPIGTYETTFKDTNEISGREEYSKWITNDRFFVFGGSGLTSDAAYAGYLNDMHIYDLSSENWRFLIGCECRDEDHSGPTYPRERQLAVYSEFNSTLFILFGGYHWLGILNSLWSFNVNNLQWNLETGSDDNFDEVSVFTSGLEYPSARYASIMWKGDSSLFMWGGRRFKDQEVLAQTWEYSVNDKKWFFVGGSKEINVTASYGSGDFDNVTHPPSIGIGERETYAKRENILFYFVGFSIEQRYYNSLFVFDSRKRMWRFLAGDKTISSSGEYSTAPFLPSSRASSSMWIIEENNVFLFGGWGRDSEGYQGHLNDLWFFNYTSLKWALKGGTVNHDGVGQYGIGFSELYYPGGRENAHEFVDELRGLLYIFGGSGIANDTGRAGLLNEMWVFKYRDDDCFSLEKDDPFVCSGNGVCSSWNFCNCTKNFYGLICEEYVSNVAYLNPNLEVHTLEFTYRIERVSINHLVGVYDYFVCSEMFNVVSIFGNNAQCKFFFNGTFTSGIKIELGNEYQINSDETKLIFSLVSEQRNVEISVVKLAKPGTGLSVFEYVIIGSVVFVLICLVWMIGLIIVVALIALAVVLKKKKKSLEDILLKEETIDDESMAKLKVNTKLFSVKYDELTKFNRIGKGGSDSIIFSAE